MPSETNTMKNNGLIIDGRVDDSEREIFNNMGTTEQKNYLLGITEQVIDGKTRRLLLEKIEANYGNTEEGTVDDSAVIEEVFGLLKPISKKSKFAKKIKNCFLLGWDCLKTKISPNLTSFILLTLTFPINILLLVFSIRNQILIGGWGSMILHFLFFICGLIIGGFYISEEQNNNFSSEFSKRNYSFSALAVILFSTLFSYYRSYPESPDYVGLVYNRDNEKITYVIDNRDKIGMKQPLTIDNIHRLGGTNVVWNNYGVGIDDFLDTTKNVTEAEKIENYPMEAEVIKGGYTYRLAITNLDVKVKESARKNPTLLKPKQYSIELRDSLIESLKKYDLVNITKHDIPEINDELSKIQNDLLEIVKARVSFTQFTINENDEYKLINYYE